MLNQAAKAPPNRRIAYLKERVRMTEVMDHFGHRYRTNGNMLCPFHEEKNPSSRLYAEQDTFWCWVCSPSHGVDIVEYVILELGLLHEARPGMTESKIHAWATMLAMDYLEATFQVGYSQEPWEARMNQALQRTPPRYNSRQFWNAQHVELLLVMLQVRDFRKWALYAQLMRVMGRLKNIPPEHQLESWVRARNAILSLS